MPYKRALAVSFFLVVAHALGIALLGTSPAGSLFSNLAMLAASGWAVAACCMAARRHGNFARSFWVLVAIGFFFWSAGHAYFTYSEDILGIRPESPAPSDVLFFFAVVPPAMALFLQRRPGGEKLDWEHGLDFLQVGIVSLAFYLFFFYVPEHWQAEKERLALIQHYVFNARSLLLSVAFLLRALVTHSSLVRTLFGRMGVAFALYSLSAALYSYGEREWNITAGTWWDLVFSLCFAVAAALAATWRPDQVADKAEAVEPPRGFQSRVGAQLLPLLLPLLVLLMASEIAQIQLALAASAVLASFGVYSARLLVTHYRQQQALEALRRAEGRFRVLFSQSPLPMWVFDPDTLEFLEVNQTAIEQYGYSRAEFLKMKITDVRPAEDVPKLLDALKSPPETWAIGPWRHRRKDGLLIDVEVRGKAIEFAGKQARLVLLQDVSERVSAERKLVATEAKFRGLVEQLVAITYIAEVGLEGRWHYVSPQIQSLLGFSPEEWMADPKLWSRQIHPEDRALATAAEEVAAERGVFEAEYRMLTRDGRTVWMRDTAVLAPGYPSPRPALQGLMLDITEQKNLEAQLRQSQKMEAVGTLAGGIAHDFNNLLTVIRGYGQLLAEKLRGDPVLSEEVRQIEQAADRAASLTSQLLAFSRKQMLQPRLFDLNDVVARMDKMLRRLIGEDVELITRPAPRPVMVKADPSQIEQVVMNLAVNARDAMPRGGKLVLETAIVELDEAFVREHEGARVGKHALLSMRDTGVGMDPGTISHIFEPFFTTKEMGRGTGLGLSTVYGIVKQSGGYISVSSQPGKGTGFHLYLPRAEEEAAKPELSARDAGTAARGSETILVLEDDEALRKFTCRVLSASGYTVLPAWAGTEAERLCREHAGEIHLLVTDMIMPDQSGVDAARLLSSQRPAMKVLYVSGYSPDRVFTELGPEAAFLQKPFTTAILTAKVREVLDGPRVVAGV